MTITTLLFLFRVVSAILLLLFVGGMGWVMYQEMSVLAQSLQAREQQQGWLRWVNIESEAPVSPLTDFPLLPITTIGRSANNVVILTDTYASSQHALLSLRGQQWWLEDLDSSNGTLLNQVPIETPTVVSMGDIITIGNCHLKIELL